MEFFVENWLWFLVGAVVIIMTLIGYIAEKTDFGRKEMPKIEKNMKPKKEKKKDKKEIIESKPEVQMSLATNDILNDETLEQPDKGSKVSFEDFVLEDKNENLAENVENNYEESIQTLEIDEDNLEQSDEDSKVSFENVVFEEPNKVSEVVQEIPEQLDFNDVNTSNIELPDLDTIVTDDDSDDVWKF